MSLTYGFVKCKVVSDPQLKATDQAHETQYHLHATLEVAAAGGGTEQWDTAINVGTDDSDDLLKYKLIYDFQHTLLNTLQASAGGFTDLTGSAVLPALDFLRSDVLTSTGPWRNSDPMDGSDNPEPVASLLRLLQNARQKNADVYIFGRTYTHGGAGIHDVHMNQGSGSQRFLNNGQDDHNDHNDVWQDGAVIVDFGQAKAAAYFTAFTQQLVPTDDLGNPVAQSHPINDSDAGSLKA